MNDNCQVLHFALVSDFLGVHVKVATVKVALEVVPKADPRCVVVLRLPNASEVYGSKGFTVCGASEKRLRRRHAGAMKVECGTGDPIVMPGHLGRGL